MNERAASKYIRVFRRLETDAEFHKRLAVIGPDGTGHHFDSRIAGAALDEIVWELIKKQRRIVEDQA